MGAKSSTEESAQNRRSRVDDGVTRQDWVGLLSSRVRLARSILITDQSLVTDRSMSVAGAKRPPKVRSPRSPFVDHARHMNGNPPSGQNRLLESEPSAPQ